MCIVQTAVGEKMTLDEATLNSEEIKPVALSIVELCLAEGIRQAGRRAGGWAGGWVGGRAGRQAGKKAGR